MPMGVSTKAAQKLLEFHRQRGNKKKAVRGEACSKNQRKTLKPLCLSTLKPYIIFILGLL